MSSRRLGVFGGTFDPVHSGHLVAAVSVRRALELDEVVFVPTGHSWHKVPGPQAPALDRLAMVQLAVADYEGLTTSTVDIDRLGPTYTVDTLTDLQRIWTYEHPDDQASWFFITGADALADVQNWRDPEGIIARAQLVGVSRPGHVIATAPLLVGHSTIVEVATPDISSTQVRERVHAGQSIEGLVPTVVAEYIAEHGLYRDRPIGA